MAKEVTIKFEFPKKYTQNEIVDTICGAICDMDSELADVLTYTIIEGK